MGGASGGVLRSGRKLSSKRARCSDDPPSESYRKFQYGLEDGFTRASKSCDAKKCGFLHQ